MAINFSSDRRYAGLVIPFHDLLDMVTEGQITRLECMQGIPKDAKFIMSYEDHARAAVIFVFEHPSFDIVSMGSVIPYIELRLITKGINANTLG